MYANESTTGGCVRPKGQVERLEEAIEHIERSLAELAGRLDPVTQPSEPRAMAANLKDCTAPLSRLAVLVNRLFAIPPRIADIADRIDV